MSDLSLKELQKLARSKGVPVTKRRKDGKYGKTPVSVKTLKSRLSRANVKYEKSSKFGMATVCRRGYHINTNWKPGRGQRQCLRDPDPFKNRDKMTLEELQKLARRNDISVYKKGGDALSKASLKRRLSRNNIMYI